jgi:hypothetical protein
MYRAALYLFVLLLIAPVAACGLFTGSYAGKFISERYIDWGLAEPTQHSKPRNVIRGYVEDCNGNRVPDPDVCINGSICADTTPIASGLGYYLIDTSGLESGEYLLRAAKTGYKPVEVKVRLKPNRYHEFNFRGPYCLSQE